jgi:hypothetical protein
MKYLVYYSVYALLQLFHLIWNAKFDTYTFKQYVKDVESFEYPTEY